MPSEADGVSREVPNTVSSFRSEGQVPAQYQVL